MTTKAQAKKDRTPGLTRRRFLFSMAAGALGMAWLAERTPPAFAQRRTFGARFGTSAAVIEANGSGAKFFANEANKRSNGALRIDFFADSQIGGSRDLLEGVQLGSVQFAEGSTAFMTPFLADTMVFDLPYVFTSSSAVLRFLDSPDGSEKLAIERFGTIKMRGLSWFDHGSRNLYNSRRPVYTPGDLRGLKIRVEENPVRVASLNAMGAMATPMAWAEVYGAIQQGVLDGAENSEQSYMGTRHNEVAPFYSMTNHFITPNYIVVGTSFFASLPKELQDLLVQVGKDAAAYERNLWAENDGKIIGEMKAAGVKINDADKNAFQAAVTKVQEEYAKKIPKDWWDAVLKAAKA